MNRNQAFSILDKRSGCLLCVGVNTGASDNEIQIAAGVHERLNTYVGRYRNCKVRRSKENTAT